jgi:hypothetical protein
LAHGRATERNGRRLAELSVTSGINRTRLSRVASCISRIQGRSDEAPDRWQSFCDPSCAEGHKNRFTAIGRHFCCVGCCSAAFRRSFSRVSITSRGCRSRFCFANLNRFLTEGQL